MTPCIPTVISPLTAKLLPKIWKHQIVWTRAWRNWLSQISCREARKFHYTYENLPVCVAAWHIMSNVIALCWILKQTWEFMCEVRWCEGSQLPVLHFTHSLLDQVTGNCHTNYLPFFYKFVPSNEQPFRQIIRTSFKKFILDEEHNIRIEKQLLGQKIHYPSLGWVSS